MKAILLLLLLFPLQKVQPSAIQTIQNSYAEAEIHIDVNKIISAFKSQLLTQNILTRSQLEDKEALHELLFPLLDSFQPSDLGIASFIPKEPFEAARSILANKYHESSADEILFLYAQLLSERHLTFQLHLEEKRLVKFEGKDLPINSFDAVLLDQINQQQFGSVDYAKIEITADAYTPFEFVTFITSKLREVGIKKISFKR